MPKVTRSGSRNLDRAAANKLECLNMLLIRPAV